MTNSIVEFIRSLIGNDYLSIIIIAMLPLIELRGAIPIAIGMGYSPYVAFITSYLGTSIVIPFLLLLLKPVLNLLKKIRFINKAAMAIEEVFQHKADKVIRRAALRGKQVNGEVALKYKLLGVYAFVALPLPMTGVWTGSAVAAFLNIRFWPALFVILLGNLTAAVIMTLLAYFFMDYLDIIIGLLLLAVVVSLISYALTLIVTRKRKE